MARLYSLPSSSTFVMSDTKTTNDAFFFIDGALLGDFAHSATGSDRPRGARHGATAIPWRGYWRFFYILYIYPAIYFPALFFFLCPRLFLFASDVPTKSEDSVALPMY